MPSENMYVCSLTTDQSSQLKELLASRGWEMDAIPYSRWRARHQKLTVVSYQSGKLTAQGKGTGDFVRDILEPEILKKFTFGYEAVVAEQENPEMFKPHAGIDESGKGDFFGPLVVACVYTDAASARALLQAGVADSKTIKSEAKINQLASLIRKECAGKFALLVLRPQTYNRLYDNIGNLNRLLAWGHAKALENLLELVPDCPRAISDQFAASEQTLLRALQERGRRIRFEQHPRAETDVAVAAASILARAEFVRILKFIGDDAGVVLPKGGGPAVKAMADKLREQGADMDKLAKLHFKI